LKSIGGKLTVCSLEVALGHTENAGQMREYSAFRQQIYKLKQIARNFGMDLKYYSTEKVLRYYLKKHKHNK